ncbi:hypothetical protein OC842_006275 [Tilletia horrida]|uniref:Uncharacterized protein n=1 Tax=Tilletia horrida TaxID=155126 RepID=A0AAN6G683_9BASI|nr:hypothetical protein OC842_006275 [Tilletia horrida]
MRASSASVRRAAILGLALFAGLSLAQTPPSTSTASAPPPPAPSGPGLNLGPGSGALCDPRRSTLDPLTHRFRSDCSVREWCMPNPLDSSQLTASPSLPSDADPAAPAAVQSDAASSALAPPTLSSLVPTATHKQALASSAHLPSHTAAKSPQQASVLKQGTEDDGSGSGSGSAGDDSGSGYEDDEGDTDDYGEDGEDAIWRRSVWDTVDEWQAFRRAVADTADTFNQSDFVPSAAAAPVRLSLPPDFQSTGSSAGLPTPTSGVCRPKGCRRDEYPFGYKGVPQDQIPPMCGPGTYCPDEENACEPLIPLGGVCQLNRDDSCSPPSSIPIPTGLSSPNSGGIFSSSSTAYSPAVPSPPPSPAPAPSSTAATMFDPPLPSGLARRIMDALLMRRDVGVRVAASQGGNGTMLPMGQAQSAPTPAAAPAAAAAAGAAAALGAAKPMCLQGICHLADAAQGQACIIDHTQYLGYDSNGKEVVDTVSRDNCRDKLFCDEQTRVCLPEKIQGESCAADRECLEFNCNTKGVCDLPPEAPNRLPAWAFVLIGLAILSSLLFTVYGLYRVHLAHRASRAEEIDRYFSEQWTFRQSILSMHAAALAATGGMGFGGGGAAAAAAAAATAGKTSLLVGSPNGSVYMSPLGARHLRVLSVDRRDSDDSDQTLLHGGGNQGGLGLVHPHNYGGYQHQQQRQHQHQQNGTAYLATGVSANVGPGADSASNSPFLDGRLSKRKPAPAV